MINRITFKDPKEEKRLVGNRIFTAGAMILILLFVLIARIFFLQVIEHEHYTTLSQDNRVKIEPLSPIRGLIFSSDNVLLADNRPSFSLEVVPERIDDIDRLIRELGQLIRIEGKDIIRFKDLQKRKRRFESIPLRFNLTDEEVAKISVNRHLYSGVDVIARLNRYYPLGANLAHAIGYVGMIDEDDMLQLDESDYRGTTHIGKLGVEKAYEDLLHGQVGYQQVEVNAQGRIIRVLDRVPSEPGKNIFLTLNVSLQNLATSELDEKKGSIVAIDPRNGGVLALVSSPGYDPNPFVNGIDSISYKRLLDNRHSPLLNRALQGKYPPGSTIKPFVALSALDDGIREHDDKTYCPGWFSLPGTTHRYRDWKKEGHGETDLSYAIANSCDVYFYALANEMGINKLHPTLAEFGFGLTTGIDIGGESAGLLPSPEWKRRTRGEPWYPGETVIIGIGQGSALVTPIQLAKATATLANRGQSIQPHLFAEARDPVTSEVTDKASITVDHFVQVESQENWQVIIDAMIEVVHGIRGTARRSGMDATYQFGGKTGTAQVFSIAQDEEYDEDEVPEELRDHALFIAFAPADEPEIAVSIIVENGESGSTTAAPIARRLFDQYFSQTRNNQG